MAGLRLSAHCPGARPRNGAKNTQCRIRIVDY
jgi:hypothetical protein